MSWLLDELKTKQYCAKKSKFRCGDEKYSGFFFWNIRSQERCGLYAVRGRRGMSLLQDI